MLTGISPDERSGFKDLKLNIMGVAYDVRNRNRETGFCLDISMR
jgi:hypothetical protein